MKKRPSNFVQSSMAVRNLKTDSITASGLAKKYSLSYPLFLSKCREESIPIPPSGYWTRFRLGIPVEQPFLSGDPDKIVDLVIISERKETQSTQSHAVSIDSCSTDVEQTTVRTSSNVESTSSFDGLASIALDTEEGYAPEASTKMKYDRGKLYREVWTKPVTDVAKQYGVSNVALSKTCRSLKIPLPYRGYWAEVRAGKKVSIPALPEYKEINTKPVEAAQVTHQPETVSQNASEQLAFLTEQERKEVFAAAMRIELPTPNVQPLRKILTYKPKILEWNKKHGKEDRSPKGSKDFSEKPPFLSGVIAEASLPRVFRILDAIYRQVELLGGKVNSDLSITIRGKIVTMTIVENQDTVPHVITKSEAELKLHYIDDKRRGYAYGREPIFRKYDYLFNGKLRITVHKGRHYRDSENEKVEDHLGDILIDIFEESEIVRLARVAAEAEAKAEQLRQQEAERKRREEERIRQERQERYNAEIKRTRSLINQADDYDAACKIRAYVAATSSKGDVSDEVQAWIIWANNKADWFDPTIAREDDELGVREHGADANRKELKTQYIY